MAHTPSEWQLIPCDGNTYIVAPSDPRIIGDIATVHNMGADTDSNAALIKASPKLLLMLEEFVKINASGEYEFDTNEPRLYKAIVNAIAEANRTVSNGN